MPLCTLVCPCIHVPKSSFRHHPIDLNSPEIWRSRPSAPLPTTVCLSLPFRARTRVKPMSRLATPGDIATRLHGYVRFQFPIPATATATATTGSARLRVRDRTRVEITQTKKKKIAGSLDLASGLAVRTVLRPSFPGRSRDEDEAVAV